MLITVVVVAATGILFLFRVFIAFSLELWDGRKPAITNSKLRPGHAELFMPAPQSSRVSGFESRLRSAAMAVNEADERAEVRHFDQWARRADF